MPLVAPSVSSELGWSKTEVGSILSSFFWGYALTQILGGYLSDRFGAEKIILAVGAGWALVGFERKMQTAKLQSIVSTRSFQITFWFHQIIVRLGTSSSLGPIILFRVVWGACQGAHFPAVASLCSR